MPMAVPMPMAIAVAVAVAGLSACGASHSNLSFRYVHSTKTDELIPLVDRRAAGPVQGALMTGAAYHLAADRGQVVVLNYFASWCGPCAVETPQFDAIYRARHGGGVTFVGVDAKDSPRSKAADWLNQKGVSFPVIYDPSAETALELGGVPIMTLPATVLIDKHGRVAAVYQSALLPADLNPVLDQLADEA
ncbi:MAG: alkyl hydroperoxide reductase [Frankiales bacterium]|nr:alkyl hydroperoxide reductase [Frankiales bacterium]